MSTLTISVDPARVAEFASPTETVVEFFARLAVEARTGGDVVWTANAANVGTIHKAPMPVESDRGAAHHRPGHRTEISAAELVLPRAGILRRKALEAIAGSNGGMTDAELAAATETYLYTIAPRRTELLRSGWVRDSGRTRTSDHGRDAIVWELSDAGRAAYLPLVSGASVGSSD